MSDSTGSTDSANTPPTALREARSARGRRTRDRLVAAAREAFEELGYLDTNISDIAERAGVAHASFYTYFPTKRAVFRALALALGDEVLSIRSDDDEMQPSTLYQRVERANRDYLEAYRRNARIMDVVEQVATLDDEVRAVRREARSAFVARSSRFIGRLQSEGVAHADLDPTYVANALGAMVDRYAYVWFVLGEEFDFDESIRTLTALWLRALGLDAETAREHPVPSVR